VAREGQEALFKFDQRREIVGREDLSLNDREIDFDLIEPTGVDRSVDEDGIGPFVAQTVYGFLAAMSGAVVHNPKDTVSRLVGLLAHDLADEPIHRSNPTLEFTAPENSGPMDIPSCQVGPGACAGVLVLDARAAVGCGRQSRMDAAASLHAGLLVCGNDVVINAQRSALPNAFVQIEDGNGFSRKVGIAREDPAAMLPRAQGIAAEPSPQSRAADLGNQTLRNHVLADLLDREPGQGQAKAVRKLTSEGLNLNDEAGGKSGPCARLAVEPPGRVVA